jgi:hypothetical protein
MGEGYSSQLSTRRNNYGIPGRIRDQNGTPMARFESGKQAVEKRTTIGMSVAPFLESSRREPFPGTVPSQFPFARRKRGAKLAPKDAPYINLILEPNA